MSHIETGNTKLSLPVLVDIASALEVRTDDLLSDGTNATTGTALDEIAAVLERCTAQEAKALADIVKAAKLSMDKYCGVSAMLEKAVPITYEVLVEE